MKKCTLNSPKSAALTYACNIKKNANTYVVVKYIFFTELFALGHTQNQKLTLKRKP